MHLTFEHAKELLEQLARENPDYIYREDPKAQESMHRAACFGNCLYKHWDGSPGCIIGHLISRFLGHTEFEVVEFNSPANTLRANGITYEVETVALLSVAQRAQDEGKTWSEAVSFGLETYRDSIGFYSEFGY